MKYNPEKHHRRSIRLKGYDYSRVGAYFITICTNHGEMYFENEEIKNTAEICWLEICERFEDAGLDEYVVMPNHIHGIIVFNNKNVGANNKNDVGARFIVPSNTGFDKSGFDKSNPYGGIKNNPMVINRDTLGKIIRFYKAKTSHIIRNVKEFDYFSWQRNYYEHIIRDEEELNRIRKYITENPIRWEFDRENPAGIPDKNEKEFWKDLMGRYELHRT